MYYKRSRWDMGPGWRYWLKWTVGYWLVEHLLAPVMGWSFCPGCERWRTDEEMDGGECCDQCCSDAWDREQERIASGEADLARIAYMDSIDRRCEEAGRPSPFGGR
jgi:hypothetical protein